MAYHTGAVYAKPVSGFPITIGRLSYTVNPERIASVIFNDFINPATLTSLYDNDFSRVLHAHAHNVAH